MKNNVIHLETFNVVKIQLTNTNLSLSLFDAVSILSNLTFILKFKSFLEFKRFCIKKYIFLCQDKFHDGRADLYN